MAGLANIVKNEKNIVTDAYQQVASHNAIYRGKVLVDTIFLIFMLVMRSE